MSKRAYLSIAILGIFALLFLGAYFVVGQDAPPILKVGPRHVESGPNGLSFTWQVENRSDRVVTFDEDAILQIQAGSWPLPYSAEAKSLQPGEAVSLEVFLEDVSPGQYSELTLTAASNEGTTASHVLTLP